MCSDDVRHIALLFLFGVFYALFNKYPQKYLDVSNYKIFKAFLFPTFLIAIFISDIN